MSTQTRTWQRKILEAARRDAYADLYWYVEVMLPGRRSAPAVYPAQTIPVIAVAPEPEITRHYAHMLVELLRAHAGQPAGVEFVSQLIAGESLNDAGVRWYVYGDVVEMDAICYACGAVGRVAHTVAGDGWLCRECAMNYEGGGSCFG